MVGSALPSKQPGFSFQASELILSISALSPTPPFPQDPPRLKLAGLLVPAVVISMLTTSAMFMKMTTFFVGFGFFADPIIWRAASWLNRRFPNWKKLLELRK